MAKTARRCAEEEVIRAAVGCIDKKGYAFRIATEESARTYFINEAAFHRLEAAVDRLEHVRTSTGAKR